MVDQPEDKLVAKRNQQPVPSTGNQQPVPSTDNQQPVQFRRHIFTWLHTFEDTVQDIEDAAALQHRQGRRQAGLQPQLGARLALQPRSPETSQPPQPAIANLLEHAHRRTIPEGRRPALYPVSAFTSIDSLFQRSRQLQSQIQPARQCLPSLRPTPLGQSSSRLFLQTTQPYSQELPPKNPKASPIKVPLVLTTGETHAALSIAVSTSSVAVSTSGDELGSTLSAYRPKRQRQDARMGRHRKRIRTHIFGEYVAEDLVGDLAAVVSQLDAEFAEKERLSYGLGWCKKVPRQRQVATAQAFYRDFHNTSTLPLYTCRLCYCKVEQKVLREVSWTSWVTSAIPKTLQSPLACSECFSPTTPIEVCSKCIDKLDRGALTSAGQLHCHLQCDHVYPPDLQELTLLEEKLISLNSCYGWIISYTVPDKGSTKQSLQYPRHVKGHITVFPNSVQDIITKVLPHPLVKVLEDVYVSWHGREKPAPRDLSKLLSVRRRVVERALVWLRRHNPLYAGIEIDAGEMELWGAPSHGVPAVIYNHMQRDEPSAREKTQTAQLVSPCERGLENSGAVDIADVLAELVAGDVAEEAGIASCSKLATDAVEDAGEDSDDIFEEGEHTGFDERVDEVTSTGMFPLDARIGASEANKLQFMFNAAVDGGLSQRHTQHTQQTQQTQRAEAAAAAASAINVEQGPGMQPYIRISRGDEFADQFDASFFAKTFPTLFPHGIGGPRIAEEAVAEARRRGRQSTGPRQTPGSEAGTSLEAAQMLASSRNLSLGAWAKVVLRRHGGRFARHPVFPFLIFNMQVRYRNRAVSMVSVKKQTFPKVERLLASLTEDRLNMAKAELEAGQRTRDEGVQELLRCLSMYGYRQPLSMESRLSLRRKIKSIIVRYGIPAIWFTLNPNDITNPVKLRMAAYRTQHPEGAEAFLQMLDTVQKRAKLAVSDPLSAADFFYREIMMFFKHYVKVGSDSIFGRVSQYFAAVETNQRGALHVHGLLWLEGNLALSEMLDSTRNSEGEIAFQEAVIQYIDSVFCEARGPSTPGP